MLDPAKPSLKTLFINRSDGTDRTDGIQGGNTTSSAAPVPGVYSEGATSGTLNDSRRTEPAAAALRADMDVQPPLSLRRCDASRSPPLFLKNILLCRHAQYGLIRTRTWGQGEGGESLTNTIAVSSTS